MTKAVIVGAMMLPGVLFSICVTTAQDAPIDREKAKIVSRVYQATYGAEVMCKRFSPQESAQVSAAVLRFKMAYPELMALVEQSSYFEPAKNRFIVKMEKMAASALMEPRKAGCQEALTLLNQFLDTANGKEGIMDVITQLKK